MGRLFGEKFAWRGLGEFFLPLLADLLLELGAQSIDGREAIAPGVRAAGV